AGAEPGSVGALAAAALGLARGAVADVRLVTEGGWEKTAVADLADAEALEKFLESNEDDCYVEVGLRDPAVASLWDGDGCLLARTCLVHLCPTVPDVVRRFEELLEVRLPSPDCITFAVDDDEDAWQRFDGGSHGAALAHAQGGGRVTLRCAAPLHAEAAEVVEGSAASSGASGAGGYGDDGFEEDQGSSGRCSARAEPAAAVPRAAPAPRLAEGAEAALEAGGCLPRAAPSAPPGAAPGTAAAAAAAAAASEAEWAPAGGRAGDSPGASSGTARAAAVALAGAGRPYAGRPGVLPAAHCADAVTQTLPQAEAATQTAPQGWLGHPRAAAGAALGAGAPRQPRAVAEPRGPPGPAASLGHRAVQAQPPLGRALRPVATAASGGFGGARGALPATTEAMLVEQLARRFSLDASWAAAPAAPPARAEREAYRDMLRQVALGALDPAAAHEASELLSSRWRAPVSSVEALRVFRRCLQDILTDDRVLDVVEHQMECHFAGAARAREQPVF
ncbi:unnamed protein product, partial [Prorocentrum cordatum]